MNHFFLKILLKIKNFPNHPDNLQKKRLKFIVFFYIGPKILIFLKAGLSGKRQKMVKKRSKKGQKRGYPLVEKVGGISGGFLGGFWGRFWQICEQPCSRTKKCFPILCRKGRALFFLPAVKWKTCHFAI